MLLAIRAIVNPRSLSTRSNRACSLVIIRNTPPTTLIVDLGALARQLLRKRRPLAQLRTLPVDDVDGNDEDEADAEEDRAGVL